MSRAEGLDHRRPSGGAWVAQPIDNAAWVNWPARVAAMIAAELEVDPHQVHTVLERQVREHLNELAEVRPSLR